MVNLDIAELRLKLDLDGKFVDFSVLRTALTVLKIVSDLDINLSEPNKEGECRARCPKCGKDRSFAVNINTNRFICFAKGCGLKGGGVIDFYAKLYGVSAKEASHLLACAYGIQPYAQETAAVATDEKTDKKPTSLTEPVKREVGDGEISSDESQTAASSLTAQHLIATIEFQLAQLKKLLSSR
jgi:hypothetical protein